MNSSSASLTPLGKLLIDISLMPVPRRKSDLNKLKISAAILILKNLKLTPTIPYVSKVTGIPKQRISEIDPSELLSGCYTVDKLLLKPLLDSRCLTKVRLKEGGFQFETRPLRKYGHSKAQGSRGKFFSAEKTAQMLAYEELKSEQSKKIEEILKQTENPAAAWLIRGTIMSSQLTYLRVLTDPCTIRHLEKWYKLFEPIAGKALILAKKTGVKVPKDYTLFYRFGWLKIAIAVLVCNQSDEGADTCMKKLLLDPDMRKIIDEYKATS